jgi:RNase P subunit RPR2
MEVQTDGFYLGFPCHKCKAPIEIVIDDANEKCKFVADEVLQIICPDCGHQAHYATKQVQRYPGRAKSMMTRTAG